MLEMSKNIPLRQRWDYHRHFPILSLSLSFPQNVLESEGKREGGKGAKRIGQLAQYHTS